MSRRSIERDENDRWFSFVFISGLRRGKKPGLAFWATVVVAALTLYVGSFGPLMWWLWGKLGCPDWMATAADYVYGPLFVVLEGSPQWANDAFWAYSFWWSYAPYQNVTGRLFP